MAGQITNCSDLFAIDTLYEFEFCIVRYAFHEVADEIYRISIELPMRMFRFEKVILKYS